MDTPGIAEGTRLERDGELLWNIRTVTQKTGLSRASIYRYIKRERFPPRRRVGPNRVAWVPAEILAWIESRPQLNPRDRAPRHDRHRTKLTTVVDDSLCATNMLGAISALHGIVQTTTEDLRSGMRRRC